MVPDAIDSFAGAYGAASFYCGGSLTHRDQFGRTSNVYNIDVSAQYAFNLGEIGEVVVRADVFNVFNFDDEVEVSEVGEFGDGSPCPQFLMDNYYQLPRYLQLSLSYRLQ